MGALLKLSARGSPSNGNAAQAELLMQIAMQAALPQEIGRELRGKEETVRFVWMLSPMPSLKEAGSKPDAAFKPQSGSSRCMARLKTRFGH